MTRVWRNLTALLLTVAYVAVVSFGHQFHNHGLGGRDCACCSTSARTPCHASARNHAPERGDERARDLACDHACHATSPGVDDSPRLALSADSQGSRFCPICDFYSHHGTLPAFGHVPTSLPVCEPAVRAGCPVAIQATAEPQQPRAPPFSA
ncbi:MAG TPA: hypothetical protein DD670_04475 [Planctomycetaceae bacterium]|nr:hypothetical protein [Planctomycetaceae bacterium]